MHATIRPVEWEQRSPDQPVLLVLHVGPADGPGDETFQLSVCTPAALTGMLAQDGIVIGRHLLLVDRLDRARIELFLTDRIVRLTGATWDVLGDKISRLGYWEFEDYTPYRPRPSARPR